MPTVKVVDVISRTQTVLQDTTATRWPVTELQNWLNDGYREIVILRPDVNTATGTYTCAAGTRQSIASQFPTALRVLDVVRNVAAGSSMRSVRGVDRRQLDDQRPAWHAETQSLNIAHYVFDPRLPKSFMTYPPATSAAQLEVLYSAVPSAHTLTEAQLINTATTEVIRIDDSYANALLDYVLYRAYTKDADYAGNAQRAVVHYQAMQSSIGAKSAVDGATGPGAA